MNRKNFLRQTMIVSAGAVLGMEFFNSCKKENPASFLNNPQNAVKMSASGPSKINRKNITYMVVENISVEKSDILKAKFGTDFIVTFNLLKTVKRYPDLEKAKSEFEIASSVKTILEKSTSLKEKQTVNFNGSIFEIKDFTKEKNTLAIPSDKNGNPFSGLNIQLISEEKFHSFFSKEVQPLIA